MIVVIDMAKHKGVKTGAKAAKRGPGRPRGPRRPGTSGRVWLFGSHAVLAALANPDRKLFRLLVTEDAEQRLGGALEKAFSACPSAPSQQRCDKSVLSGQLPEGAVHQGLALEASPLDPPTFEDLLDAGAEATLERPSVILALDQVTDPHNVGAILRSAAAFGASAVVAPRSHAAPETGTLAKAASGALERVPYVSLSNLARAMEQAANAGYLRLGLDGEAETALPALDPEPRVLLVLGAEGHGLRRLTREHCDRLARLPTRPDFGSLNVSNAAAVALYEVLGRAP